MDLRNSEDRNRINAAQLRMVDEAVDMLKGWGYRVVKLEQTHAADSRMGAEYVIEEEL